MPKRLYSTNDRDEDADPNFVSNKRSRRLERETNEICQGLYDALRSYKNEDGRIICESFIRLPSKRTHAEYYTVVKQPIDLLRIQQKIRTDEYRNLSQFSEDIQLLVTNSKSYYKKNSTEWRDAVDLWNYYNTKKSEAVGLISHDAEHSNDSIHKRRQSLRKPFDSDNMENDNDSESKASDSTINEDTSDQQIHTNLSAPTSGRRRRRKLVEQENSLVNGEITAAKSDDSNSVEQSQQQNIDPYYLEEFFTAIYNAKVDDRPMSDIFLFVPSRKLYPDYYEIIKEPIDLKMIAKKIQLKEYISLENMENDLLLMVSNAKKYNDPKSQIYKDACSLKKTIINVRNELDTARKTSKSSNDRLRPRERDELLSAEVHQLEYPLDEDVVITYSNDDVDSEGSSLGEDEDSFRLLYNAVKSYKLGVQSLIDPFMKLPNKRFYPDYYEEIKRPIAMSLIKNHIKKNRYVSLADLVDDLQLMFANAMQYNQEGSLIYNSAKKLLDLALLKAHELGYDERKRSKNYRNIITNIKDEPFESSPTNYGSHRYNDTSGTVTRTPYITGQRGRPPKKAVKYTEQNIRTIYSFIRDYRENDISLITPYLQLPSASDYPDYYDVIQTPIDMDIIKDRMEKGMYKREQDLVDDLLKMFKNAKKYNMENSSIYINACKLERVLNEQYRILMAKKEVALLNFNASTSPASTTNRSTEQGSTKSYKKCLSFSSLKSLQDKLNYLFNAIKHHKSRQGRMLSTEFLTLPSKADYPDYYEIIERPIDIQRIQQKLSAALYLSLNDLINDIQLMLENACLYNEPGSTIYKDSLSLQRVLIERKRELTSDDQNIPDVQLLVGELMLHLFIATFNHEDEACRCFSDSFAELPERVENEPFEFPYTFDFVKRNLDRKRYRRLDVFQDDMFKVFERARKLSRLDSQLYEDSIELQTYFIHTRDDMCCQGKLLNSPALFYNETSLTQDIAKERNEKGLNNSINPDFDENKEEKAKQSLPSSAERSSSLKGQTFYLGDFVYIEPREEVCEPHIVCIESFSQENNEDYVNGLWFYRPDETYHLPTRKFLKQEVFLTNIVESVPVSKIIGHCYVSHVKDYFKYRPVVINQTTTSIHFDDEKDVYVCESRYNTKTKMFKKIKLWNMPGNNCVKLVQRIKPLEANRDVSSFVKNEQSTSQDEQQRQQDLSDLNDPLFLSSTETIEKLKHTLPINYSSTGKLNDSLTQEQEQSTVIKQYYEQVAFSNKDYYKLGDYVYISSGTNEINNNNSEKRLILRIDKIWKENENPFAMCGSLFLRPCDITNREQLIFTTKANYGKEVVKCDNSNTIITVTNIISKCSVLSLKHYCTSRTTEIPESDVYLCESKYVNDDQSIRKLSKGLKRPSLSAKACMDEIYKFKKEFTLRRDLSIAQLKSADDVSFMDAASGFYNPITDDNSNVDGDETNISLETTPLSRGRRGVRRSTRNPCGYLVYASEARKRLIKDNPSIPFGEMSRMIGEQWRRLTAAEKDKYEEKARERAKEQEVEEQKRQGSTYQQTSTINPNYVVQNDNHVGNVNNVYGVHNNLRMVNGCGPTVNGHYQSNSNMPASQTLNKPALTCPPKTQRLVHSEAYLRYIENLKSDNPYISDWPKQLKASMNGSSPSSSSSYSYPQNNGTNAMTNNGSSINNRSLPTHWLVNGSGIYNNVTEALWSMRDNMFQDVIRIRDVLSHEW